MRFPEDLRIGGFHNDSGVFIVQFECRALTVIAADAYDWEHVSVSLKNRCPNWKEMSHVKNIFWDEDQCVMQLHPSKASYVDLHPYCLHLWRPKKSEIPLPPLFLV